MSDSAEREWAVHAAYLAHLSTSPLATRRAVGDGFAVRTGLASNSENGVVSSHPDGDPADVVAWMDGVPARWLAGADPDLGGPTPESALLYRTLGFKIGRGCETGCSTCRVS